MKSERDIHAQLHFAGIETARAEAEKRFLELVDVNGREELFELKDSAGRRIYPEYPGGTHLPSLRGWFKNQPQA